MTDKTYVLGQPQYLIPVIVCGILFSILLVRSYLKQNQAGGWVRGLCIGLKLVGFSILAYCLLEPLIRGTRPTPGENVFVLLADRSESLNIKNKDDQLTRGEKLLELLKEESTWQTRLAQEFDVRKYWIGTKLESVDLFDQTQFSDMESRLKSALTTIGSRLRSKPVAGVLFLTDGNATDNELLDYDETELPPIYPVVLGDEQQLSDLEVAKVTVTQSNFEAAPVRVSARIVSRNAEPKSVYVTLLDEQGQKLQQQVVDIDEQVQVNFKVKPDQAGIRFYTVKAVYEEDNERLQKGEPSTEGTQKNNQQTVVVDRGRGPFRVLYVSGRPNWEFKFLNRALAEDREVNLVGLIRIAKKKPKFDFRRKGESSTSEFFKGFEADEDEAEQYFEPVLLRLGTKDENELRGGFPKKAEDLFRYDAIICDDVESKYFTFEQMSLIQRFVSERGGGFLMLGGQESFVEGKYSKTPIADLLPVYVNPLRREDNGITIERPGNSQIYRFQLSRLGELQPWVRLRETEEGRDQRLARMPNFASLNKVPRIKPGADEMAFVVNPIGENHSALVTQKYGKGRAGALLIGDLWRWALDREVDETNDLAAAWRQTVRWLVGDVPGRVEVSVDRSAAILSDYQLRVQVRDEEYLPLDNAEVEIQVTKPDGSTAKLLGRQSDSAAGLYLADFPTLKGGEGNYLAKVVAKNPDGTMIESRNAGWVYSPANQELEKLNANRTWLESLAQKTGGETVEADQIDAFIENLPNKPLEKTETAIFPLWHHMVFFWIAIICLAAEWGIRRINGLP